MFPVTLAYFMTYKYVIGLYFNIQKYNASAMSVEIQKTSKLFYHLPWDNKFWDIKSFFTILGT